MSIKKGILIGLYFSILFCTIACIDESVKNIDKAVYLNPSYSLPIGPIEVIAKEIINTTNFQIYDSSVAADTTGYFWYDSVLYNDSPGYFDTTIVRSFDFSSISDKLDLAKSLMLRLNAANGFPTDILTQLYFGDGNGFVLDSLFSAGKLRIPAASTNSNGDVISPSVLRNYDTYFDRAKINRLKLARSVIIFTCIELRKDNVEYIKLFPFYRIDLDFALRIELDMNLGDI